MGTILTYPDLGNKPSTFSLQLVPNTQSYRSPLSKAVQTLELPGALWTCKITYDFLQFYQIQQLKGFFAQLRGAAGRFLIWDMVNENTYGNSSGNPHVAGAGQKGNQLIVAGFLNASGTVLKVGDMFAVNNELKIVTVDANADVNGTATITFEPPLRSSPPDQTPLVTTKALVQMKLKDDNQASLPVTGVVSTQITFEMEEVF